MARVRPNTNQSAHGALGAAAEAWADLDGQEALRSYGFRHGVAHLLSCGRPQAAESLLTDFAYDMGRLKSENGPGARPLAQDAGAVKEVSGLEDAEAFRIWEDFLRTRVHILARGDANWGAEKILLQLAVEHADDSPVTLAAEAWLEDGRCDWLWLRRLRREPEQRISPCIRTMEGHGTYIIGILELPNGLLVTWSFDHTLRIWSPHGVCTQTLVGHSDVVRGALWMAPYLISWSWDGTLRIWDIESGRTIQELVGHEGKVTKVIAFEERRIVSLSEDFTLRLWDPQTRDCLFVLKGHEEKINGACFVPGIGLLSWSDDGTIRAWCVENGACLSVISEHTGAVNDVKVISRGRILSCSDDGTVRAWHAETGACLATLEGCWEAASGIEQLSDEQALTWFSDGTLCTWCTETYTCLAEFKGHTTAVNGVVQVTDGLFVSYSDDETCRIWSLETGTCLHVLQGHQNEVWGVARLDEDRLASYSMDRTIRIWSWSTGECLAIFDEHTDFVGGVRFLKPNRLASYSFDLTIRIWSLDNLERTKSNIENHSDCINGVKITENGRVLSSAWDGQLRVWEPQDGRCVSVMEGHKEQVWGTFELTGGPIVSWSLDKTIRTWCPQTYAPREVLSGHEHGVQDVMALPDGRILSYDTEGTIFLWSLKDGQSVVLDGHTESITDHLVLPDRLVTCSYDQKILTHCLASGRCIALFDGHGAPVLGVIEAFGKLLAWSEDHVIHLWGTDPIERQARFKGHTDVIGGAIQLDGDRFLTWSEDHSIRVWSVRERRCITDLLGHNSPIHGAALLLGNRLFSWSSEDLWVWCLVQLKPIHSSRIRDLPYGNPSGWKDLIMQKQILGHDKTKLMLGHHAKSRCVHSRGAVGALHSSIHLTVGERPSLTWMESGQWDAEALLENGQVIGTCANDLAFLQLHYGNRRVTLKEADALLSSEPSRPAEDA